MRSNVGFMVSKLVNLFATIAVKDWAKAKVFHSFVVLVSGV